MIDSQEIRWLGFLGMIAVGLLSFLLGYGIYGAVFVWGYTVGSGVVTLAEWRSNNPKKAPPSLPPSV